MIAVDHGLFFSWEQFCEWNVWYNWEFSRRTGKLKIQGASIILSLMHCRNLSSPLWRRYYRTEKNFYIAMKISLNFLDHWKLCLVNSWMVLFDRPSFFCQLKKQGFKVSHYSPIRQKFKIFFSCDSNFVHYIRYTEIYHFQIFHPHIYCYGTGSKI